LSIKSGEWRKLNLQFQKVISGLEHHAGITDIECWKVENEEEIA
jgi:hypothetical protein